MTSYIFAILFLFLTFYISKKIYKDIGISKPLYKQIRDNDDCYWWCLSKNGQVNIDGVELYYRIYSSNAFHNYVQHITVCIDSGSSEFFEIRRQTLFDKLLTKISLLKSYKMNDSFDDNNFLIISDNPELNHRLDTKLLHKIEEIFNTEAPFQYKHLRLYNQNGELCLKFFLSTYFTFHEKLKIDEIEIDKTIERFGKKLLEVSQNLQLKSLQHKNSFENVREKISWIKYLIVSSAVGSFFMMIYQSFEVFPQTIDTFRLIYFAFVVSSLISVAIFITIMVKLNESIFKFKVASKYALFSLASTITISGYTVRYFNTTFDNSKEEIVYRKVVDKTYGFKGHKNYHLKFPYAYAQTITGDDVKVSYELYKNVKIGDTVKIFIKDGYFNIRYIDDIINATHNKSLERNI